MKNPCVYTLGVQNQNALKLSRETMFNRVCVSQRLSNRVFIEKRKES